MKALFDALNVVYGEQEKRGFIKLNAVSLAFTAAAIGFVLVALGAMVILPIALDDPRHRQPLPTSSFAGWRWPALFLARPHARAGAALSPWSVPCRAVLALDHVGQRDRRHPLAGRVGAVHFFLYAASFGSYNKTYGSLGAIIGFMVWIGIPHHRDPAGRRDRCRDQRRTVCGAATGAADPPGQRGAMTEVYTVGAAPTLKEAACHPDPAAPGKFAFAGVRIGRTLA